MTNNQLFIASFQKKLANYTFHNRSSKLNPQIHRTLSLGNFIAGGLRGKVYNLSVNENTNLNTQDHFVVKIIIFNANSRLNPQNERAGFIKEVQIGTLPNIGQVGPKIIASYLTEHYGMYIAENLNAKKQNVTWTSMPVSQYLNKFYPNGCPHRNTSFMKILLQKIHQFYIITGGYHGDLHHNNMVVYYDANMNGEPINLNNNGAPKVEDIMIFDYGSHRRFCNTSNLMTCDLSSIFEKVKTNFAASSNTNSYQHQGKLVKKSNQPGQSFMSNLETLLTTPEMKEVFEQALINYNMNFGRRMARKARPTQSPPNRRKVKR